MAKDTLKRRPDMDPPPPAPPGVPPDGPVSPGGDAATPPPHGTARPAEPAGPLPRVVDPLERAGRGQQRFRVACHNYAPRKARYILAAEGDEAGARACYLAAEGLDREVARLQKIAGEKGSVEDPDLVLVPLDD